MDTLRPHVSPLVQDYLRACERLLAALAQHQYFSEIELEMVNSYAVEIENTVGKLTGIENCPMEGLADQTQLPLTDA